MIDIHDYSLKQHNTFGIEARCDRFLEYSTADEAKAVADILRQSAQPFLIIGGGSNLLLTQDFKGIVVRSAIKGITPQKDTLRCGSGEVWDDVVDYSVKHGYYGMENLSWIPGDVGASAVQNIGAYGVEVKDFIETIEAIEIASGALQLIDAAACRYAYRQSRFKGEWKNQYLITHVTYRTQRDFQPKLDYGNIRSELERQNMTHPTASQLREVIIGIRQEKLPDPAVMGNAGSFFMNPIVERSQYEALASQYENMPHYTIDANHEKIPAGWMIDQCGWKGRTVGHAGVHDRQALVLVNRGNATGQEIVDLCRMIQRDVKEKFGITIKPEVNII